MVKSTDIEPLKGPDRVRKRPSVLFGSDDERGCEKMIRMLIDFGFCEYVIEQADQIAVIKCEDGSYIVENNGGSVVPVEAASCNNGGTVTGWEEIFCGEPTECNPPPGKAAYFNRNPIFGFEKYFERLALFAGNAASSYMTVDVVRNGWKYTLCFQKGRLAKPIEKERFPGECGLCLHFLPDAEVFTSTDFDFADIFEYAAGQAALHPGLSLSVKDASSAPVKKKTIVTMKGFATILRTSSDFPTINAVTCCIFTGVRSLMTK